MTTFPQKRGFTLIETLFYVAILIVATIVVVGSFLSLRNVLERNRMERIIATAGYTVLDRVARTAQAGTSVDTAASTLDETSSILTLLSGATTTTFSISEDTISMTQNGDALGALTPPGVAVTEFRVFHFTNSFSEGIRIKLSLTSTSTVASTTETFFTTAVLRGSYE